MKKPFIFFFLPFFVLLAGCATTPTKKNSDTAVMLIRINHEKELKRVIIALNAKAAPETVANFKKLAEKHFYDGLPFHRLFSNVLVQSGDPNSRHGEAYDSGTGGPGYTIPAEIGLPHVRGAIATARLADRVNPTRASNGSQFYICLKPLPQLNGNYTVFGQVLEGLDVLDSMSTLPTNSNNFPLEKVFIKSLRIESIH